MQSEILQHINYIEKKFWNKVNVIDDENSCWEWLKEKDKWGYGVVHIYQKSKRIKRISASKASWIIKNKQEITDGLVVCHKCDNRKCVRPDHLFLGTHKDNMQDCKNKGRLSKNKKTRNLPYKKYKDDNERFLCKIIKQKNECWEWISSKDKSGYGVFLYKKKVKPAHRVSWQLFVGEIPEEKIICHKCDNRLCVNPNHLFIGTNKDNAVDCYNKKRNISQTNPEKTPKGELHGNAKLSNKIILEIINDYKNISLDEISKKYKITKNYINNIIKGKIWTSVTKIAKYQQKEKYKTIREWITIAENLAKEYNNKLPKGLRQKGFRGLETCIKKNPNLFKHLF